MSVATWDATRHALPFVRPTRAPITAGKSPSYTRSGDVRASSMRRHGRSETATTEQHLQRRLHHA